MEDIILHTLQTVVVINLIIVLLIPILFMTVKKMKDYYQNNKAKVRSKYEKLRKIMIIVDLSIIAFWFIYMVFFRS